MLARFLPKLAFLSLKWLRRRLKPSIYGPKPIESEQGPKIKKSRTGPVPESFEKSWTEPVQKISGNLGVTRTKYITENPD